MNASNVRLACLTLLIGAWLLHANSAQNQPTPREPAHKAPDIGFNYRRFIEEHQELINDGKVEQAVAYIRERAKFPDAVDAAEKQFLKYFASIHTTAGPQETYELVGYKRYSSRHYQFFIMAYHQNASMLFGYGFEKHQGKWKWVQFSFQTNLEEASKLIPLQPIDDQP